MRFNKIPYMKREGAGDEGGGDGGSQLTPEQIAEIQAENTRLKEHQDKLLGETKTAKQERQEAAKQLKELQDQMASLNDDKHRKAGDVEALEKSWQEKLAKREGELNSELEQHKGWLKEQMVTGVASSIAAEIAVQGSAKALQPHLTSRLSMEVRDGKPTTVVLDAQGKPSAMTVDELKAEFTNDPAFAPLIVGSKASGGGASGGGNGGGAATKGSLGGDRSERTAALKNRFPELNN
ncbi:hypothetical protein [uncultured Alcanivorax sp.]|uniref:hypothetical protein n=1 Tax=uncultured Alcanivorax sp. TaxID=191215 RepID=UPI0032B250F0